jgi:methionyl-tRNA formyltransferase
MRLCFMGSPSFAVPSLEVLLERPGELVAVYTQPDRPRGRGLSLAAPPVKRRALAAGVEVRQPPTLKDDAVFEGFAALDLDLCVVAAYGRILGERYLEAPRLGCINVHASLLPKYRGAAPIQWAIVRGETKSGITLMQMDRGLDTGDILLQRELPIDPEDTAETLEEKLSRLGASVLKEGLERLRHGPLPRVPQDHAAATLAPLLRKEDGEIDWTRPAPEIVNLVRGMTPWPSAHTRCGGKLIKIHRARAIDPPRARGARPGTLLEISSAGEGRLEIACGEGALSVLELQIEGGKRLGVGAFAAGARLKPGDLFSS